MTEMPDLNKLSLQELHELHHEIDVAIRSLEVRRLAEARAKLEATARELGVTLEEVLGGAPAGKAKRKAKTSTIGAAKFRHPENPSLTWTGRGRRPAWFIEAVESGIGEDAMKI